LRALPKYVIWRSKGRKIETTISAGKMEEPVDENGLRNLEMKFGDFSINRNERTKKWQIIFA